MKKIITLTLAVFSVLPMFTFAQATDLNSPTPSCTPITITHNFGYGFVDAGTNGDVSTLQNFLEVQGYLHTNSTGYFGVLTQAAVKAFQSANGISTTGYVGPITMGKINSVGCATTSSNPVTETNLPVVASTSTSTSSTSNSTSNYSLIARTWDRIFIDRNSLIVPSNTSFTVTGSTTIDNGTLTFAIVGPSFVGSGDWNFVSNLLQGTTTYPVTISNTATVSNGQWSVTFPGISKSDYYSFMTFNGTTSLGSDALQVTGTSAQPILSRPIIPCPAGLICTLVAPAAVCPVGFICTPSNQSGPSIQTTPTVPCLPGQIWNSQLNQCIGTPQQPGTGK